MLLVAAKTLVTEPTLDGLTPRKPNRVSAL